MCITKILPCLGPIVDDVLFVGICAEWVRRSGWKIVRVGLCLLSFISAAHISQKK
jgi:hypothetical protein